MKNQALFSLKDKSKKFKCRLLRFLFGALRVKVKAIVICLVLDKVCNCIVYLFWLSFFQNKTPRLFFYMLLQKIYLPDICCAIYLVTSFSTLIFSSVITAYLRLSNFCCSAVISDLHGTKKGTIRKVESADTGISLVAK